MNADKAQGRPHDGVVSKEIGQSSTAPALMERPARATRLAPKRGWPTPLASPTCG
jgi:hypothetical protein